MEATVRQIAEAFLLNVRPSGESNLRCACPFHESGSSHRTFSISLETGLWCCYGCNLSGSLRKFLRLRGVPERDLKAWLPDGVEDSRPPPGWKAKARVARTCHVLPEGILGAWSDLPPELLEAGFQEEILREMEVGLDRKNDRIVFPIRDEAGRLIAVSGRSRSAKGVRYSVYDAEPPAPPWNAGGELWGVAPKDYAPQNREVLYGFHTVLPERYHGLHLEQPLLVTEGYKSTLWARQQGFRHAVGLQGSSLTEGQLWQLCRVSGKIYVLLDHEPGKAFPRDGKPPAAWNIARAIEDAGGDVLMCVWPLETPLRTSPDDISREALGQILYHAITPAEAFLRWMPAGARSYG